MNELDSIADTPARPVRARLLVGLLAVSAGLVVAGATGLAADQLPHQREVDDLLSRMSLEEKIGQMVQIDLSIVTALSGEDALTVSVEVRNTGNRAGREVVELHTRDLYASIAPPGRRLRAFQKFELQPGESATVEFQLSRDDLAFVNANSQRLTEPGDFEIMIGNLKAKFRYEDKQVGIKAAAHTGHHQ